MPSPVSTRERCWIVLCFTLGCFVLFGGRNLPEVDARERRSGLPIEEFKVFADVFSVVQRDYVREVDTRKVIEGAIKGMLATLDPHSGYLDPDFYQDLQVQTRGEFGGLGIEVTIRDGLLVVVSPMEGSPAERAGIRPGDSIIKIDGKFAKEFSLVEAVKKLRGPKGSAITLSISRAGEPDLIEVTLVRDNIMVRSVRSRYLGDGFGYVRINQFMEKTTEDLRKALQRLHRSAGGELRGLILDLRNNPGGLLTQAVSVSDLFLKEGVIVYTDGRVEAQRQKFYAHARGTEPNYPIVVLVNGGSASASEIVAGAMKDHGRALVLGTQTFGKGSVQTITSLDNGGALTLTTALYYTKSGRSIQVTGVTPDIEIEAPEPEVRKEPKESVSRRNRRREGDLPGAIENPSGGKTSPMREINQVPVQPEVSKPVNPEEDDLQSWYSRDPQMERAVDLLKTFNIFVAAKEEKAA